MKKLLLLIVLVGLTFMGCSGGVSSGEGSGSELSGTGGEGTAGSDTGGSGSGGSEGIDESEYDDLEHINPVKLDNAHRVYVHNALKKTVRFIYTGLNGIEDNVIISIGIEYILTNTTQNTQFNEQSGLYIFQINQDNCPITGYAYKDYYDSQKKEFDYTVSYNGAGWKFISVADFYSHMASRTEGGYGPIKFDNILMPYLKTNYTTFYLSEDEVKKIYSEEDNSTLVINIKRVSTPNGIKEKLIISEE